MEMFEKTLSRKEIFQGRIINVHLDEIELPDGSRSDREVVEHSGGVCVAAVTDNKGLLFVRQYRYPYHKVLLELPAGKLEKGEDPLEAGIRELEEECGVRAESVVSMGTVYPTVAYCSEIIHLFLAKGLVRPNSVLTTANFFRSRKSQLRKPQKWLWTAKFPTAKRSRLCSRQRDCLKRAKYDEKKVCSCLRFAETKRASCGFGV